MAAPSPVEEKRLDCYDKCKPIFHDFSWDNISRVICYTYMQACKAAIRQALERVGHS